MNAKKLNSGDAWHLAVRTCELYLSKPGKADVLLAKSCQLSPQTERRRCQHLFYGILRNLRLIEYYVQNFVKKAPRLRLKSIFYVSTFELIETQFAASNRSPQIIDHAVGQTKSLLSQREAGFVNAVLRKVALAVVENSNHKLDTSIRYSHPKWLVEQWQSKFETQKLEFLLQWNLQAPPVFLFALSSAAKESMQTSRFLESTKWDRFYRWTGKDWSSITRFLENHEAYVMDPASRIPIQLLSGLKFQTVLDLCAAPGGKSIQAGYLLSEQYGDGKTLLCVDNVQSRVSQLADNLKNYKIPYAETIHADALQLSAGELNKRGFPPSYDVVLLDAPCSNTGVLRRRPDAKWRLSTNAIQEATALQEALLQKAAAFVKEDGHIVYSTCSIEPEENQELVNAFLADNKNFRLLHSALSFPWKDDHDGGGAFLLRKITHE